MTIDFDKLRQQARARADRPTGYYWIRFPGQDRWQPGSWDQRVQAWMLIGSDDPWLEFQLEAVAERIERVP